MRHSTKRLFAAAIAATSATTYSGFGFADIPLNANTIQGTVRFTNTDSNVLAILATYGMTSVTAKAENSVPSGYSSATVSYQGTPIFRPYQLFAEASNVTYEIRASASLQTENSYGEYRFPTPTTPAPTILLQPVGQQPSGVDVDFDQCVGVTHFRFGTDSTCTTPVTVSSGNIYPQSGIRYFANTTEHHLLLPDGTTNEAADLFINVGTDPSFDLITVALPQTLNATCDVIQDVCIDMSPYTNPSQLGSLTGPFDVIGEVEQGQTRVTAYGGPAGNARGRYFSPAEMPISTPGDWWVLPNMVPGDYYLFGDVLVRADRTANFMRVFVHEPSLPMDKVTVVSGQSSDLQKTVDGQSRYPFAMTPARFEGSILLVDPSAPANGSGLSDVVFASDDQWSTQTPYLTRMEAVDQFGIGLSLASFEGNFDTATGNFVSSYEQLIVNAYDIPSKWMQGGIRLYFDNPTFGGAVNIQSDAAQHLLGSGDVVTIDHAYCFSEVTLRYTLANATMFNPYANGQGGFQGMDWRGINNEYTASYSITGWPRDVASANSTGDVHLVLPQGTYTAQPGATIVAPGGSTSTATFKPIQLELGCGQRGVTADGLSVSAQVPACADSQSPTLTGTVFSDNQAVNRIWYTINGGPDIDICAGNCGTNPSYNVSPTLATCENTITVFASSGAKTASITSQITWDDPNNDILCPGACGTPPPVQATCASIVTPALTCSGNGDSYELTFTVTNNTLADLSYVSIPDPHVSPHAITLPTPLAPGESTNLTVSVQNVNPGAVLCMDVGVSDSASDGCCSQEVCVDVPGCCFSVETQQVDCIEDPSTGMFKYSFDMTNRTLTDIEHVFLFPPAGVTVSPDYVDVPTTPPGGTASIGPIAFTGTTPGETVCVHVGVHDENLAECCAKDVCFTAPNACPVPSDDKAFRAEIASCALSTIDEEASSGAFWGLVVAGCFAGRRRKVARAKQ